MEEPLRVASFEKLRKAIDGSNPLLSKEGKRSKSDALPPHLKPGRVITQPSRRVTFDEVDDDEVATRSNDLVSTDATVLREHELVDDSYTYFPLLDLSGNRIDQSSDRLPDPKEEKYVPGQQVIPPGFHRYRVDVQYVGSDFDGWSKTTEKSRTVKQTDGTLATKVVEGSDESAVPLKPRAKQVLEDALAVALDLERVEVVAGAIPETGCTVRRLTCHVDLPSSIEMQPRTIMQRATMWLEKKGVPFAILSCQKCKNQQFHARHSGSRRVYVYRVLNRIAPPLFDAGLQWHVDRHLDVDRMARFAEKLTGTMDYGFFADAKMAHTLRKEAQSHAFTTPHDVAAQQERQRIRKIDNSIDPFYHQPSAIPPDRRHTMPTTRTIDALRVVRQDDEVLIWFAGKSFLRHQIRNMVAVLKMAGQGLWTEKELEQALAKGFEPSRTKAAREKPEPAPVHGLTLWEVEYPPQHRDDYVNYVDSGPFSLNDVDISNS